MHKKRSDPRFPPKQRRTPVPSNVKAPPKDDQKKPGGTWLNKRLVAGATAAALLGGGSIAAYYLLNRKSPEEHINPFTADFRDLYGFERDTPSEISLNTYVGHNNLPRHAAHALSSSPSTPVGATPTTTSRRNRSGLDSSAFSLNSSFEMKNPLPSISPSVDEDYLRSLPLHLGNRLAAGHAGLWLNRGGYQPPVDTPRTLERDRAIAEYLGM